MMRAVTLSLALACSACASAPEAPAAAAAPASAPRVALLASGLQLNGQPVSASEFERRLRAAAKGADRVCVHVDADMAPGTPGGRAMLATLNVAKQMNAPVEIVDAAFSTCGAS